MEVSTEDFEPHLNHASCNSLIINGFIILHRKIAYAVHKSIRCALPEVVTAVFGALYSVVDGLFVGRFLGEDALAAVNLIMPVIMIIEAISNMIATGASVQMSVLLGKGNRMRITLSQNYGDRNRCKSGRR